MRVEEAAAATAAITTALGRLVGQVSSTAAIPTGDEIQQIVDSAAKRLLLAREKDDSIVGTLTLALFRIPTGVRAWIEDVVVDEAARGQGVGKALTEQALRLAQAAGARTVELTSRPEREAANQLYESLGFKAPRHQRQPLRAVAALGVDGATAVGLPLSEGARQHSDIGSSSAARKTQRM